MRAFAILLFTTLCTACLPVYKLAVNQGNIIDEAKLEQLEPGMTPEQVRFLMGTPLVVNDITPNRWDYVAYVRYGDGRERQRTVTLWFEKGVLDRIDDSGLADKNGAEPGSVDDDAEVS